MTEPGISQRAVAALAALVHECRPDWHEAGVAAETRKHPQIPLVDLAITMLRAASIPSNDTPACISQEGNAAWNDDRPYRCRKHPENRARRTNGECASCWADRQEKPAPPMDRGGVPMPEQARADVLAALDASIRARTEIETAEPEEAKADA